jgi:hypothetical protein
MKNARARGRALLKAERFELVGAVAGDGKVAMKVIGRERFATPSVPSRQFPLLRSLGHLYVPHLASQARSEDTHRTNIETRLGSNGESDALVIGTELETYQPSRPRQF